MQVVHRLHTRSLKHSSMSPAQYAAISAYLDPAPNRSPVFSVHVHPLSKALASQSVQPAVQRAAAAAEVLVGPAYNSG